MTNVTYPLPVCYNQDVIIDYAEFGRLDMPSEISYTTEEIAKLLRISKLTVYDLIKKGKLPAYRVGKQMRVDADDLEAYKRQAKGIGASPRTSTASAAPSSAASADRLSGPGPRPLVISGQDMGLDILAKQIEAAIPGVRPLRSHVGSMEGLISMYRNEADIVSVHLLDGDTGEYNLPYVRKLLVGRSYVVVNLLCRQAGLYVREGNPLGIRDWRDLGNPGIRIVNRETGSGARVLLDEQLRLNGVNPADVAGYDHVENNHLAVAGKVALGEADAGVGIGKAADIVGNVSFVPLVLERYDLVMAKTPGNAEWLDRTLAILGSADLRKELGTIQGYDLSLTGRILWES